MINIFCLPALFGARTVATKFGSASTSASPTDDATSTKVLSCGVAIAAAATLGKAGALPDGGEGAVGGVVGTLAVGGVAGTLAVGGAGTTTLAVGGAAGAP